MPGVDKTEIGVPVIAAFRPIQKTVSKISANGRQGNRETVFKPAVLIEIDVVREEQKQVFVGFQQL